MRFLRLLTKDSRILLRNRALLVALLIYPFLLAAVLGAAFSEAPTRLDVAVFNGDQNGALVELGGEKLGSDALVASMASFGDVKVVMTEAEALALVRKGEVDAALIIPKNFVRDLAALGQGATLRVVVDESDPIRAEVAKNAVEGAIKDFTDIVVQKKIQDVLALISLTVDGGTTRVAFVDVDVLGITRARQRLLDVLATVDGQSEEARKLRDVIVFLDFTAGVLGNAETYLTSTALPLTVHSEGLASTNTALVAIALPGALVLGVFWTGSLASALLTARDVETGVRRRLAAAPLPRVLLGASRGIIAVIAALVPAAILIGLGALLLGGIIQDPVLTFAALLAASLAAAAFGALAAVIARGSSAAALLVVLTLLPMLLLGGLFYPVAYMPVPAQFVARVLPLTLATDALRGAMLRGASALELAPSLVGLLVFAILASVLAGVLARKK